MRASNSVLQLTVDSSADFVSALEQVAQLVPSQVLSCAMFCWPGTQASVCSLLNSAQVQ